MTKLTPSRPPRLTLDGSGPATPSDAVVVIIFAMAWPRGQRHSVSKLSAPDAWLAGLHPLRPDDWQCIRPLQELEQLSGCVRRLRVRAHAGGKGDVGLDLGWERPDQIDAGRGHDLRDDDHPKLDFALGDKLGHDIGVRPRDLRRDRLGDAEAVQQRSQVNTAADLEIPIDLALSSARLNDSTELMS